MPGPPASFWDRRYAEAGYAYGTAPNSFLAAVADRLPPGRVLCLAEGQGRNAVFLAERGHAVVAVDQSAVGMARAEALAAERGVQIETVVADLDEFAIEEGAWEAVVSIFAHVPPAVRQRLHRSVVAGLRPGGALVLEAYTPAQSGRGTGGPPPGAEALMMTAKGLRAELDGLRFEILREVVRSVQEGRYHTGPGAVVQALAVKPAAPST